MAHSKSPVLLLLPNDADAGTVEQAARAASLPTVRAATVASGFAAIAETPMVATFLSLAGAEGDERIVRRFAESDRSGALVLTADGVTLDRALLAERVGALHLLREPLPADEVAGLLSVLADEGPVRAWPGPSAPGAVQVIGESVAMQDVFATLARVARTDSTVLVTGPSGTGKEVIARALHQASRRASGPFVAVNCAAIPEHLLESELFGHERGAFTGAVARREGRIQRAQGGTLFLDEIGDMSLVLQAKILRVLEERVLEPVGGKDPVPVDCRIVAATNQVLDARIRDGAFREDLYYRLAVVRMSLPPLRDRGADVHSLALQFGADFNARYDRGLRGITHTALERLAGYEWPGNVRELRNVMDRAVVLAAGDAVRTGDLRLGEGAPRGSPHSGPRERGYPATLSLDEVEADHIARVLRSVDGHMGRAAEVLGVHRNTLTRKVKEYGLTEAGSP